MKRLLVVDDDPDILFALEMALEGAYLVRAVHNGAEALEALEEEPFDLVLLDMMMPFVDGPAVVTGMRARGLEVPVVLMSAGADLVAEAQRLGVRERLAKPYDLTTLEETVERALRAGGPGGAFGGGGGAGAPRAAAMRRVLAAPPSSFCPLF